MEQKMFASYEGTSLYLFTDSDGTTKELSVTEVQQKGVDIICNPFLTRFWPQNEENMTLIPVKFACNFPRVRSWRRMQLTSPPITSLSMTLWYTLLSSNPNVYCNRSTDTFIPQVHQTRRLRLPDAAVHQPRAYRRDARPLR